ncbi:MAG TPA: class I SAM-dependent methyltransferase [Kofleriaceae bacterium]|nr:class I SAM-dependent methyltransferase [Kofleriaceae bacterium]
MRWIVLSLVGFVAVAACQRTDAADKRVVGADKPIVTQPGEPVTGSAQEQEQARFDSERKPEKIIEALALRPGDRVADIGAGSGLLTIHLARAIAPNGHVVATDIDGAVLDLLSQRLEAAGLAQLVERRVVGADTPDLEANTYDAILLSEVDHYFTDPASWLRTAATALKPGGRIVISNRVYHRAQSMAAARKAGLVLKSESNPDATRFIAVFVPPEKKP